MALQDVVVEARSLVKSYGEKNAVDGVTLKIQRGECFGLLGPNGAGKSSLMRMMYCASPVTSGELFVLGLNVRVSQNEIKSQIGVVPQEDGLDPDFNVLDNLLVYSRYHNIPTAKARIRARELLRLLNLDEEDRRPVEALSGGMRRRLVIARGLINQPKLLILDEPTTGLDPQARNFVWETLEDLKRKGVSQVLTTHYMEEAERLCDRIAIIDHGKILCEGKPQNLIYKEIGKEVIEFTVQPTDVEYHVNRIRNQFEYQVFKNRVRIFISEGKDTRAAMNQIASDNITVRRASLDDVFLKLAGYDLRD